MRVCPKSAASCNNICLKWPREREGNCVQFALVLYNIFNTFAFKENLNLFFKLNQVKSKLVTFNLLQTNSKSFASYLKVLVR